MKFEPSYKKEEKPRVEVIKEKHHIKTRIVYPKPKKTEYDYYEDEPRSDD